MNPFLRPRAARRRTRILAQAPSVRSDENAGTATLRLYDPIDSWGEFWGVSAREFTDVLDQLPDDTEHIRLLINSPGGEVYEGLAILNALRSHPAHVTAVIEGIAASAASFVAAGVNELHMAQNSELFVHRAWAFALGNAADLTQAAATLEHHDRNIANVYARKSGGDVDEWLAAMTAETYYSDQEAVDAGLADLVIGELDGAENVAAARARFDLSVLAQRDPTPNTPAAGPRRPGRSPSATGRSPAVAFTDEQLSTMRTSLGLAEDADEATIVEAMTEALEERADDPETNDEEPAAAGAAAARLPEGVVAVDRTQWEALQAAAQRGDEARAQQERDVRMSLVNAAVNDGRIPAARRDAWAAQLEADPGAATTLAALAPGLVPVEARGHDGAPNSDAQPDPAASDDYWFTGASTTTAVREG